MCVPNTHVLSLNSKVSMGMWDYIFFSELGCLEQYVLTSYSENTTEPKQLNKFRTISFPLLLASRIRRGKQKTNEVLNLYLQPYFRPSLLVLTLVTLGKELLCVLMSRISD